MLIEWTSQSITWFRSASAYTGFHTQLATLLLPHIVPNGTLCDLGCGAAMIDFALAPYVGQITCVDAQPAVTQAVEADIACRGLKNISVRCADVYTLRDTWDTVLLVFFGRIGDNIQHYLRLCRKNVIAVVRGGIRDGSTSAWASSSPPLSVPETENALREKGLVWHMTSHVLEYGQPLRDYRDAVTYTEAYRKNPSGQNVDEFLRENLQETGRTDYPLYLPYRKQFGLFRIEKAENPQFFRPEAFPADQ